MPCILLYAYLVLMKAPARPRYSPPMLWADWLLIALALLGLLAMWAAYYRMLDTLPDRVPIHFDLYGRPDRWGSASGSVALPIVATLVVLLLTLVGRVPHLFNYPLTITLANHRYQYTLAVRLLRVLALCIVLVFGLVLTMVWLSAAGQVAPGIWLMLPILALVFGPITVYMILAQRHK